MKSTIQPQRMSPMKQMMAPVMTASAEAMTLGWLLYSGRSLRASVITVPVTVDKTATGYQTLAKRQVVRTPVLQTPIVISLDVAKNQYIKTPMNEEYKPNSTGRSASLA